MVGVRAGRVGFVLEECRRQNGHKKAQKTQKKAEEFDGITG
jgi:hypothetical protein